jgi:hypothetical protein
LGTHSPFTFAFIAISIIAISPIIIASADGELIVDRSSIKLEAQKDKILSFSILVKAKEGQTNVTSYANDLVEENGFAVIPSSSINATLVDGSINSTSFGVMTYSVDIPADQRSGLYKGKIILLEQNGTITEIPVELSVRTDNDYVAAFWLIFFGALLGAIWEGINKARAETGKVEADKAQSRGTIDAVAQMVGTKLGTDVRDLAQLNVMNENALRAREMDANARMEAENTRILIETGMDAERKLREAKGRHPLLSTLLQVSAILLAAVLATTFVFNQFVGANPFFSPEFIQGILLAISFGFAAYLSFENLVTQAKKTINPNST